MDVRPRSPAEDVPSKSPEDLTREAGVETQGDKPPCPLKGGGKAILEFPARMKNFFGNL